jgi:hypothetical protein
MTTTAICLVLYGLLLWAGTRIASGNHDRNP